MVIVALAAPARGLHTRPLPHPTLPYLTPLCAAQPDQDPLDARPGGHPRLPHYDHNAPDLLGWVAVVGGCALWQGVWLEGGHRLRDHDSPCPP